MVASIILLICAAVTYLFIGSPLFLIKEIEVSNSELINVKSLLQWKNRNIFLTPLSGLRERINEIPEVRCVLIKKELPHKITIIIHEYEPHALLRRNRELAVSREGVVFPFRGVNEISDYPLVIFEKENFPVGESWPGLKEAMQAYLFVKDIVPIEFIKVGRNNEVFFYTKNTKTEIRMGSGEYKKKISCLKMLMKELPSTDVDYIDLRFGEDVIVKP